MLLPTDPAAQLIRAQRLAELIDGFPERIPGALPALREMLDGAVDDEVLAATVHATGLAIGDDAALGLLLDRQLETHRSGAVRSALVRALATVDGGGALAERAAAVLARTSADADAEVRGWSCFALGRIGADGPAVREALLARIGDENPDAHCEAVAALARLDDRRVVDFLRRHFEDDDPFEVYQLELTAAATLADPSLLPGLLRIDAAWQADRDADSAQPEVGAVGAAPLPPTSAEPVAEADEQRDDGDDEDELFAELDRAIAACRAGRPGS
jgi:hypothetical protein